MNQVAFSLQLWAGEMSLLALIFVLTMFEILHSRPVFTLSETAAFDNRNRQSGLIAAIGMGLVFLITLFWGQGGHAFAQSILNFSLKAGGGTAVGKITIVGAGLLAILMSYRYTVTREIPATDFYLLLAFSMLGALTLICAENLLVIFLALEMMSIPVYALVGLQRYKSRAGESALKYLLLGGFSGAFLLLGISFLYGASGSLHLPEVLNLISNAAANPSVTLLAGAGLILLFVGLAFKVSLFPFHAWTPDVYEGAATPVTAYMSVVIKLSAFAVILRIFGSATHFTAFDGILSPIITLLALATVIYGNTVALVQQNIKRMLAYSSIAHAGYMALALAPMQHSPEAAQAVLFYGMGYVAMNTLAFAVLIYLTQRDFYCETLDDLRGLAQSHPVAAAMLALAMFSLAGIPPAVGFVGKLQVFLQLINAEMYVTTVIALLASLVSLYFYLNVIVQMYMRPAEGTPPAFEATGKIGILAVLLVTAVVTLFFGILPSPLMDWAWNWAQSLY